MKLAADNRELWLWLFQDGGAYTAHDLALQLDREVDAVFWQLTAMARRGLVDKLPPLPGSRRLRYAVSGTCLVPHGLCVAEAQAPEPEPPARKPASAPVAVLRKVQTTDSPRRGMPDFHHHHHTGAHP